jgi:hypothetical protein
MSDEAVPQSIGSGDRLPTGAATFLSYMGSRAKCFRLTV